MTAITSQGWVARGVYRYTWTFSATGDGDSISGPFLPEKSVQVFAGTGTITIQGSNDGSNWATLKDPSGNDISFDATSGIEQIMQNPRHIRPTRTGTELLGAFVHVLMQGKHR